MTTQTLDPIVTMLGTTQVDVLLIGAHALTYYGVPRPTTTVDLMVCADNVPSLMKTLDAGGFQIESQTPTFMHLTHRSPYVVDVGVLWVDSGTFKQLHDKSQVWKIGPGKIRVPSVEHLISLKLHVIRNTPQREEQDIADIRRLVQSTHGELGPDALRALCEQIGPPGIFDRIQTAP